jgi:tRNA A-37 threonylcarbamoyl transferase component Bud32
MPERQLIEPRARTRVRGPRENVVTGRLPEALLSERVQRFGVFSIVAGGLWAFALAMHTLIVPRTFGTDVPLITRLIEILGIVTSGLAFWYVRHAKHDSHTKANAALGFMLLNAFGVAMFNISHGRIVDRPGDLSWNTIVILVFSMIMPTSPAKMLGASVAAASMDPLAVWIAHLRGVDVPSVVNTLVLFTPNYVCAVVAAWPAYMLQCVGRQLREAQEMGSYQLLEPLAGGGMGEVWRAKHRFLARPAAIKIVRPELLGASSEDEAKQMLRRFEREAKATAALSSPHTIHVFDFGATREGTFYYVMELLAGRDLDSLVREFGPAPANRALYLLRQVCHSLADAHAHGLVHRDIKPANIYVCRMGLEYDFVKVLDFGLVKVNSEASLTQTMTADQMTTGTPAFMAPEVILGERDVDRRADVYALGCVAYYLLTGQLVFDADTPMKMFMHHVKTPPIPPSQRTELPIPRQLDEMVLACLEKDPDRRPQDAQELFQMAQRCGAADIWDNDAARRWWEMHLMELTGPLTLTEIPGEVVGSGASLS